jgi:hypothetical protein
MGRRCSAIYQPQVRNSSEVFGVYLFDVWVNYGMFFPLYEREKN